jgi:osmotically-inducible protein OsmY
MTAIEARIRAGYRSSNERPMKIRTSPFVHLIPYKLFGMFKRTVVVALAVGLCACSYFRGMSTAPDDSAIRDEARAYLHSDGFQTVEPAVDHGVVTLTGHLPNNTYREKAVSDAERATGVKRVINKIEVP